MDWTGRSRRAGRRLERKGAEPTGRQGNARTEKGEARRVSAGIAQTTPADSQQNPVTAGFNNSNASIAMATATAKTKEQHIIIKPPAFETVEVIIEGTAPLVIARFSKKMELMAKMAEGKSAKSKKDRSARDYDKEADQAKYWNSTREWEGANAAGFRAGMISACRLVGFKMTLAKLSVFVEADDFNEEGTTPLVRIYGESTTNTSHTRNTTGVVDVRARPMYKRWACSLRIRYDSDQFSARDVVNLISRVGLQVGIGEGRPDSKSSAGCGWGTFRVVGGDELADIAVKYGISI